LECKWHYSVPQSERLAQEATVPLFVKKLPLTPAEIAGIYPAAAIADAAAEEADVAADAAEVAAAVADVDALAALVVAAV
jgi:hypothetical protein